MHSQTHFGLVRNRQAEIDTMRRLARRARLVALLLVYSTVSWAAPGANVNSIGKLIDSSSTLGFNGYAYAPSIIYDGGKFHMFYCSQGSPQFDNTEMPGDAIRYAHSIDGRLWSKPVVALQVSDRQWEAHACDPSVVEFTDVSGTFFYLFYSGNTAGIETVMFVARAERIEGPYKKFTKRRTWESNAPDPMIILWASKPVQTWYGAGQQTVVSRAGKLFGWYTDDTVDWPSTKLPRLFMATADTPTVWSRGIETNLRGENAGSVDVKYDALSEQFVMFDIVDDHARQTRLIRRFSKDGISWSEAEVLSNMGQFPSYSHNIGASGNRHGHLVSGQALLAFGAPYDLSTSYDNNCQRDSSNKPGYPPFCWGHWDLYASVLNPRGDVWNDICWGCEMDAQGGLALADYDGDGRTDRAIVNPGNGQWYVIGSRTPQQQGLPDIPWGWEWQGMSSDSRLALGDYDGYGKTDRAIVNARTGQWYVIGSRTPQQQGLPDIPWGWEWQGMSSDSRLALGDYDGDGRTDRAIVNPKSSQWYVIGSRTPQQQGLPDISWGWEWQGMSSDSRLALGDYDGDGKTDRAIVNPRTGQWYVIGSRTPQQLGLPDIPWGWEWHGMSSDSRLALGDYDGDGRTDRAIVNPKSSQWYVIGSSPFRIY